MTCLRFSPREHQAICAIGLAINLERCRPQSLKRFLVAALAATFPALSGRIANLRPQEAQLLHDHLRAPRRPTAAPELTAEELALLDAAFGSLLVHARFMRALKGAIIQHFLQHHPELAAKLDRASPRRFEALCEQVKLLRDGGP